MEKKCIEAINPLGQIIKSFETNTQLTRFSLPNDGVYVIRVRDTNGVTNTKVMY